MIRKTKERKKTRGAKIRNGNDDVGMNNPLRIYSEDLLKNFLDGIEKRIEIRKYE